MKKRVLVIAALVSGAHWGPMLVETDGENVLSSRGALPTQHPNSLQTVVRDQVHSKTRVRWPMVLCWQCPTGRQDIFAVGFDQHRPPVGGGQNGFC